jgi:YggT family protein
MFAQIGGFLIDSLFGFFVFLALLRFFMQSQRVSFRNPIGQLVISLTNWAVLPVRKLFPGIGGFDWASLAVAWLAQLAEVFLLHLIFGTGIALSVALLLSLIELIRSSLYLLLFIVIVQVVISWLSPGHPLSPVFDALTRPFYNFFHRLVKPINNIDLSPLFVALTVQNLLIALKDIEPALLATL